MHCIISSYLDCVDVCVCVGGKRSAFIIQKSYNMEKNVLRKDNSLLN